jgi:hypothetical protein
MRKRNRWNYPGHSAVCDCELAAPNTNKPNPMPSVRLEFRRSNKGEEFLSLKDEAALRSAFN